MFETVLDTALGFTIDFEYVFDSKKDLFIRFQRMPIAIFK